MKEETFDSNVLNISTKVHPAVKEKLRRLCAKRGLTEYEMLQMVCDCIVRYMDDRHNLTPELEQAMSIFEHMVGWRNAYNLADPTIESEVQEAVYITSDAAHKKKGFRAHLVRKPFMGEWEQTDNIIQIFERMTEVLLPEMYLDLRRLAVEMECHNLVELMRTLIDAQTILELNGEIRREFEDTARADNGKVYRYGRRTRQTKSRDIESCGQQTIQFNQEDIETSRNEVENSQHHQFDPDFDAIG